MATAADEVLDALIDRLRTIEGDMAEGAAAMDERSRRLDELYREVVAVSVAVERLSGAVDGAASARPA